MVRQIILFLLIFLSFNSIAQNVKHVRFGSTDSPLSGLTITWRSPGTADKIQWGYTNSYEKGQFNGTLRSNYTDNQFDYIFPIPVTPNSTIYYKLYDSQAALWTTQNTFITSSNPALNKFSFTALGDSRTYYSDWQTIGNVAALYPSDFVLFGGDMTDDGNTTSYWDTWFDYGANFISHRLIYYTLGNHDYTTGGSGLATFKSLFTQPGNKEYFSFTHGNSVFLVFNSLNPSDAGQLAWLKSTLAANSSKTWKFVMFHKPFYTGPAHTGEMDAYFSTLWQAFDDYGVDMIFNGHTHNYQRSKPINRNISTTSPVAEYGSNPDQGRCEVVTGAAGAPLSGLSPASWWLETTFNELNFCDIAIDGTKLSFKAINSSQTIIDQFQIDKGATVPLTGVTILPSILSLPDGSTSQLTPVFTPSNASNKNINWSSGNPLVASVSTAGIVTGVGAGTTTITGTTVSGGFSGTTSVTVTASLKIVGSGDAWKYLDNGSDQGTAWKAPAFNDASWSSGPSPLGYGTITNVPLATSTLSPYKITYYLRKNFNYGLTGNETAYRIQVMIDDGCIVYFNGIEVYRNRLTDPVNYLTLAGNEGAEGTYYTAIIPVSSVLNGNNTIAVEVHNTSTTSSDIGFDLILSPVLSVPLDLRLGLKVFLEGDFNPVSGLMNSYLNKQGIIPLSQPYTGPPWSYSGTENVAAIPADVVDWVLVELRQAASPEEALPATIMPGWPKACFLKSNGSIVDLDGLSFPDIGNPSITGNLYAVIRHRNHIAIMSSSGLNLSGNNFVYDFFDVVSKAYGGSAGYRQIVSGVCGMVSGDNDSDGSISVLDFSAWASDFGRTGTYLSSDNDCDGDVSVLDFSMWATNFGLEYMAPLKSLSFPTGGSQMRNIYKSQVPGK